MPPSIHPLPQQTEATPNTPPSTHWQLPQHAVYHGTLHAAAPTPPSIYQLPDTPTQDNVTDQQHDTSCTSTINTPSFASYILDSGAYPTHLRNPYHTMQPKPTTTTVASGHQIPTTHQGPVRLDIPNQTTLHIPYAVTLPTATHNLISVSQLADKNDILFQKDATYITQRQPPPSPSRIRVTAAKQNNMYCLPVPNVAPPTHTHGHYPEPNPHTGIGVTRPQNICLGARTQPEQTPKHKPKQQTHTDTTKPHVTAPPRAILNRTTTPKPFRLSKTTPKQQRQQPMPTRTKHQPKRPFNTQPRPSQPPPIAKDRPKISNPTIHPPKPTQTCNIAPTPSIPHPETTTSHRPEPIR